MGSFFLVVVAGANAFQVSHRPGKATTACKAEVTAVPCHILVRTMHVPNPHISMLRHTYETF